eukprot:1137821-Pelagomonas_calceolata.AAC.5
MHHPASKTDCKFPCQKADTHGVFIQSHLHCLACAQGAVQESTRATWVLPLVLRLAHTMQMHTGGSATGVQYTSLIEPDFQQARPPSPQAKTNLDS